MGTTSVSPAALDHDHLMVGRVAADADGAHAGRDLGVALDDVELPRLRHGQEVVLAVRRAAPLVGMGRVLPLAALDDVAGARERGHDAAALAARVAAGVVEVQVGVHDDVDVLRAQAAGPQAAEEQWWSGRSGTSGPPSPLHLSPIPVSTSMRFPPDSISATLRPRVTRFRSSGGSRLLPDDARHDAEHRAAVEGDGAVVKDGHARVPDRERPRRIRHRASSFNSRSTPAAPRGCTNATRHPPAPTRGVSSSTRHAAGLELGQGAVDVLHEHADVVQARALLQEARDHRGRIGRLQQLEVRLAHGQERRAHLLRGHVVTRLDGEAERLVGLNRLARCS